MKSTPVPARDRMSGNATAPATGRQTLSLSKAQGRRIWLRAQRLDCSEPFGDGAEAVCAAVSHLGYVQIDTINVIERSHHHILFTRIPSYRRAHLHQAQSLDKSVLEYWTHALSYVPTSDLRYFLGDMLRHRRQPHSRFATLAKGDVQKVIRRIRADGPLTIRDIDDDVLVEKDHPWASRKPSKRALQAAFFAGYLVVNERVGMLKSYELMDRHFGWEERPKPATEAQVANYLLDRALRAQGVVSLESVCYLDAKRKPVIRSLIDRRVKQRRLLPVQIEDGEGGHHWIEPETLDAPATQPADIVHILSPFDPLIIQRRRLKQFFDYGHLFEAYVPKDKRVLGYFALPVLVDDIIVASIDLKTDRAQKTLLVKKWTWRERNRSPQLKRRIEDELHRFERFQLSST